MSTRGRPKERPKFEAMRKKVDTRSWPRSPRDIEKEFPDYAELTSPKPLEVAEAQASSWAADEALVFIPGRATKESHVFALTREGFAWKTDSARSQGAGRQGRRVPPRPQRRRVPPVASRRQAGSCSTLRWRTSSMRAVRAGRGVDQGQAPPAVRAVGRADGAAVAPARHRRRPRCRRSAMHRGAAAPTATCRG